MNTHIRNTLPYFCIAMQQMYQMVIPILYERTFIWWRDRKAHAQQGTAGDRRERGVMESPRLRHPHRHIGWRVLRGDRSCPRQKDACVYFSRKNITHTGPFTRKSRLLLRKKNCGRKIFRTNFSPKRRRKNQRRRKMRLSLKTADDLSWRRVRLWGLPSSARTMPSARSQISWASEGERCLNNLILPNLTLTNLTYPILCIQNVYRMYTECIQIYANRLRGKGIKKKNLWGRFFFQGTADIETEIMVVFAVPYEGSVFSVSRL